MDKKSDKTSPAEPGNKKFPLPVYPAKEDIYNVEKEEPFDELDAQKQKLKAEMDESLDVPGADLDDAEEAIGEEDEENNYYSLGGEDHNDLEEDKGE